MIIGGNTKVAFKEEEAIIELVEWVPLWILDDHTKELVGFVGCSDTVQDFGVELDQGHGIHFEIFMGLHVWITRKSICRRVGDTRDVMNMSIELG